MALATVPDVQSRLASTLTAAEQLRVAALIDDASAAVRVETGQWIARVATTEKLRIQNAKGVWFVRLPQRPVNSITTVVDIHGNTLTYEWDKIDLLEIQWRTTSTFVTSLEDDLNVAVVTYNHGYDSSNDSRDVLGTVKSIIAGGIVPRAFGTPSEQSGKTSEGIGSYQFAIGPAAAQGAFGLLKSEKKALRTVLGSRRGATVFL